MKKLLLAPFLLASMFSFGGELKANPGSRYELPEPGSSLSESQSNSKDVWYLLNQTTIELKSPNQNSNKWDFYHMSKLSISLFSNRSICQRFVAKQRTWITSIDLGSTVYDDYNSLKKYRYKPYTKCIKGRDKNNSNYSLEVNTVLMNKHSRARPVVINDGSTVHFNTLYFKDLSKCNLAKSQLDNWFISLKNRSLGDDNEGPFIAASTKCFSKT